MTLMNLGTAQQVIALLTGLMGLITAGISAYFAIKNFIVATKEKSSKEIWALIMKLADAAMKEAEQSLLDGESKKKMVMDSVKQGCKAAGINLDSFIDQLSDYIDDTIKFVNDFNKK